MFHAGIAKPQHGFGALPPAAFTHAETGISLGQIFQRDSPGGNRAPVNAVIVLAVWRSSHFRQCLGNGLLHAMANPHIALRVHALFNGEAQEAGMLARAIIVDCAWRNTLHCQPVAI